MRSADSEVIALPRRSPLPQFSNVLPFRDQLLGRKARVLIAFSETQGEES